MMASQTVMMERGLLRVIARETAEGGADSSPGDIIYDVAIEGQEVLHTFPSYDEAIQFLDMVAPETQN